MASIKVKFRPSSIDGKEGTIYYQIILNRIVRQLKTNYHIYTDEWDKNKEAIIVKTKHPERYNYLSSIQEQINREIKRLKQTTASLTEHPDSPFTPDEIIRRFQEDVHKQSFFNFMQDVIAQLKRYNKKRTAETYTATFNSFLRFRENQDILMDEISSDLMMEYEAYLKAKGVTMNTVSFYMRILRAVYNRAVEEEITEQRNPFRRVYTGIDKTAKRALTMSHIRKIKELPLTYHPSMAFARDMFMFSFYTRGMSFVDMAYLKNRILKTESSLIAEGKQASSFRSNGKNACRKSSINTVPPPHRTFPSYCLL